MWLSSPCSHDCVWCSCAGLHQRGAVLVHIQVSLTPSKLHCNGVVLEHVLQKSNILQEPWPAAITTSSTDSSGLICSQLRLFCLQASLIWQPVCSEELYHDSNIPKKGQFLSLRDKRTRDESFPVYTNAMFGLTCFSVRTLPFVTEHVSEKALKRSFNVNYRVHTFIWGS